MSTPKEGDPYLGNSQRKCPAFVTLSVDFASTGYTWANSHGIFLDDPDSENTTNWFIKVKRAKNLSRLRLFICRVRKYLSSSPASFPIQIKGLEKKIGKVLLFAFCSSFKCLPLFSARRSAQHEADQRSSPA